MAVTTINGPDTVALALSTSYLGSSAYVVGSNCDKLTVWIDSTAALAGTAKFTVTNGGNGDDVETLIAAGQQWDFYPGRGAAWTLDAKSASGTPSLYVIASMTRDH
jgi:hypothetical protein